MKAAQPIIRDMRLGDLDEIVRIERTVFTDPWTRPLFEQELEGEGGVIALVTEIGGAVAAYLIAWVVLDELHIGNVAVAPARQRRGLARQLVRHVLDEAAERGCRRSTLEVRVTNEPAIALYRDFGFRAVALRRGYYRDNGEDALIMWADLAGRGGPHVPEEEAAPRGSARRTKARGQG